MTLAAQRRWIMPKKTRDVPDGIPALVAQVLACRGLATELGVDLIVPAHHHPPAELPDAYALVNPRRPGDPSIDKDLAGAGVGLMLAKRLLGDLAYALRQDELLQLCALATVADVVPLRGGNRVLTKLGLEALNPAPILGVLALVA